MTPPYQYWPCFCHTKYYFSVDNTQINISSSDFSPKNVLSYPPSGDKKSPLHCPLCLHQIRYFHLYLWLCQEHYHFLGQQKLNWSFLLLFLPLSSELSPPWHHNFQDLFKLLLYLISIPFWIPTIATVSLPFQMIIYSIFLPAKLFNNTALRGNIRKYLLSSQRCHSIFLVNV